MSFFKHSVSASFVLLSVFQQVFASDTRGYNMAPESSNIIDSQYAVITSTQTASNGLQGKEIQDNFYIRDTYFFNINSDLAAVYLYLPYSYQKLSIEKPFKLAKNSDGLGDTKILFALGVYNMPALTKQQFKNFDTNGWHAACSLAVTLPTGDYDRLSITNSGENRYSYKPECSAYWVHDNFQTDFLLGNTIYSDNTSYQGNHTFKQNDYRNIETRFSYDITPQFWASTDFIYYQGGETVVNGLSQKDSSNNLNAGFTLAYSFTKQQTVKFVYQKTVSGSQYSPHMQSGFGLTYQGVF